MNRTRIIAVVNQKGGVGKTTTTANLGYILAEAGNKVLLIDFDPQTSLSGYLNTTETEYNIVNLMTYVLGDEDYMSENNEGMTFVELVDRTIVTPTYKTLVREKDANGKNIAVQKQIPFSENLSLIPGNLNLADYELYIIANNYEAKVYQLTKMIQMLLQSRSYDYILIDVGPSLGILTLNAIIASPTGVLIPTNLDIMSTRGVNNLIKSVVDMQTQLMLNTRGDYLHYGVIGVILNLFRQDRTVDLNIQNNLQTYYPFRIFESTIPESTNAKKAALGGLLYAQIHPKAKTAYQELAREIEDQIEKMEKEGPVVKQIGEVEFQTIDDILNGGDDDE